MPSSPSGQADRLQEGAELARYASNKGVGLLAWYNSAGDWNEAMQTPHARLLTHAPRVQEFARLREMGVKGVTIDFLGGKPTAFSILVNRFHRSQ